MQNNFVYNGENPIQSIGNGLYLNAPNLFGFGFLSLITNEYFSSRENISVSDFEKELENKMATLSSKKSALIIDLSSKSDEYLNRRKESFDRIFQHTEIITAHSLNQLKDSLVGLKSTYDWIEIRINGQNGRYWIGNTTLITKKLLENISSVSGKNIATSSTTLAIFASAGSWGAPRIFRSRVSLQTIGKAILGEQGTIVTTAKRLIQETPGTLTSAVNASARFLSYATGFRTLQMVKRIATNPRDYFRQKKDLFEVSLAPCRRVWKLLGS